MDYLDLIDRHFGYLVREFGFQITSHVYHPELFGNFAVTFQRKDLQVRLIRDRDQVFVDFSLDGKNWKDKEKILQELGVSMDRYEFGELGLWRGYEIENQGIDLRKHFDLIAEYLKTEQPPIDR
jgi:hypothetical protein